MFASSKFKATESTNQLDSSRLNRSVSCNLERSRLSPENFPSLKLTKIKSLKFMYQSPKLTHVTDSKEPLNFRRPAHRVTYRRLPKFNEKITQDDPMKASKIIENINFFREQQKRRNSLSNSKVVSLELSNSLNKLADSQRRDYRQAKVESFDVTASLRANRSLSCSACNVCQDLKNSRVTALRHSRMNDSKASAKTIESILVKKDSSKEDDHKKINPFSSVNPEAGINLTESRYFSTILTQ